MFTFDSYHVPSRMYDSRSFTTDAQLTFFYSRKNTNPTQQTITRRAKAWMASIREGVVCRVYNLDHREFSQSWNTYEQLLLGIRGLSTKTLLGFVAFDTYKTMLQDEFGKISGPRTVIAGFGAGITESLFAVTPFESIKTTLCVLAGTY